MKHLVQGLHYFQTKVFFDKKGLFERLAESQEPDALFITCSDSRINPNLLTHTEPGDLFILRNAGNIIPAHAHGACGEAATIEFAIKALGIKDIIVCGHTNCGAVKGLLTPQELHPMPAVQAWLSHAEETRRLVEANYPDLPFEDKLNVAVQENVLVQLENLKTLPCVAEALERDALNLHGWVYKIQTGEVFAYDLAYGQFLPLTEASVNPQGVPERLTSLSTL